MHVVKQQDDRPAGRDCVEEIEDLPEKRCFTPDLPHRAAPGECGREGWIAIAAPIAPEELTPTARRAASL